MKGETWQKSVEIKRDRVYTIGDYKSLPEGSLYQLINGELIGSPSPTPYHQKVLRNLFVHLWKHISEKTLGEVFFSPIDVYLEEKEAYQPDIIFISRERLDIVKEDGIYGAPDLVIEILSETTAYYDMKHKKTVYERSGVKEYWIVDPYEKSVEVYENRKGKFEMIEYVKEGIVKSEILGVKVKIEEIF